MNVVHNCCCLQVGTQKITYHIIHGTKVIFVKFSSFFSSLFQNVHDGKRRDDPGKTQPGIPRRRPVLRERVGGMLSKNEREDSG